MFIGEIIKNFREKKDLSQRAFASKTSLSPSYINTLEKIYNPKTGKPYSVTTDVAMDIAKAMNISIEELLNMLDKNQEFELNTLKIEEEKKPYTLSDSKIYMCPVYGKISAGQPNWAEESIEGRLPIDVNLMNVINPEECFFLRVNGESMNEIIKDGAYALIRKCDLVDNGEIAVVLVNGYDATIKKFTQQGDLIILEPQSTDKTIQTQVYDKKTNIKILGKYIGKMEMK